MSHQDIIRDLLEALQNAEEQSNKLVVSGFDAKAYNRVDGYWSLRVLTRDARRAADEIFRAEVRAKPIEQS